MDIRSTIGFGALGLCACVAMANLGSGGLQPDLAGLDQHPEQQHEQQTADAVAGYDQGMVVVRDRDGGLRAPTAEEASRYVTPAKRAPSDSKGAEQVIRRADGSESMRLDDRYTNYLVVHRDEGGAWQHYCQLDHDHQVTHAVPAQPLTGRAEQ